jgi:hypothetical protein
MVTRCYNRVMVRSIRPLLFTAAIFCAAGLAQIQLRRAQEVPEIFDNRSPDAARIAPDRYHVELDNERLRVLRARVPATGRVPIHGHRSGILLAVTEVNLRWVDPQGNVIEIHLAPGDFKWLEAGIHAEENAAAVACEYLFIESKG